MLMQSRFGSAKCLAFCTTLRGTIDVVGTLTIRTDPEVELALESLTHDGQSRSEVVRAAILAAARERKRATMRAEAEALRADPDDIAESRKLAAGMETIRAW